MGFRICGTFSGKDYWVGVVFELGVVFSLERFGFKILIRELLDLVKS